MTEKLIFQKINNNNIPSHHRIPFRFLLINSFKVTSLIKTTTPGGEPW